jgi:hypothetical protein
VKPSVVGSLAVSDAPLGDRAAAAAYIASLSAELAKLARWHRLDTVGYLIDMVRLEAEDITRR